MEGYSCLEKGGAERTVGGPWMDSRTPARTGCLWVCAAVGKECFLTEECVCWAMSKLEKQQSSAKYREVSAVGSEW